MSVRLFAAVDLPEEARSRIAAALAELRRTLRAGDMDEAFRWVADGNLHLTLRFLGNLAGDVAPRVIEAMREPLATPRASISLGGLGTFPERGRPRMLHVSVGNGVDLLRALRDEVDARLAPICRWEPETRPFAPHLTLARARDRAKFNPVELSRSIAGAAWPGVSFDVDAVTLFSSKTLPAGPEYTAEARAALRSV